MTVIANIVDSPAYEVLRNHVYTLNQLHEVTRKLRSLPDAASALRNIARIEDNLATNLFLPFHNVRSASLFAEDPTGQPYDARRTDLEAELLCPLADGLVVTEVIRPVIKLNVDGNIFVLQRGQVLVGQSA